MGRHQLCRLCGPLDFKSLKEDNNNCPKANDRKELDMLTAKEAKKLTLQHLPHWDLINKEIIKAAYFGKNKCRINGELTELEQEALTNLGYSITFINVTPFELEHTIISW